MTVNTLHKQLLSALSRGDFGLARQSADELLNPSNRSQLTKKVPTANQIKREYGASETLDFRTIRPLLDRLDIINSYVRSNKGNGKRTSDTGYGKITEEGNKVRIKMTFRRK